MLRALALCLAFAVGGVGMAEPPADEYPIKVTVERAKPTAEGLNPYKWVDARARFFTNKEGKSAFRIIPKKPNPAGGILPGDTVLDEDGVLWVVTKRGELDGVNGGIGVNVTKAAVQPKKQP